MAVKRQTDWNNSQFHREIRSQSPTAEGIKRPVGWIVVVPGGSSDVCHMYVSIDFGNGTWQRVFAGTGTIGT